MTDELVCFGSRSYRIIHRDPESYVMDHRIAGRYCPGAPVLFDDVTMPGRRFAWMPLPDDTKLSDRITEAAERSNKFRDRQKSKKNIYPEWLVIGGEDRGGILVRDGKELTSAKCPERLSTGARVEEVNLVGDRLLYRLMSGSGPDTGWVLTVLPDKELLVPQPMPPDPDTLSEEMVAKMLNALIIKCRTAAFQDKWQKLHNEYSGFQRTLAPFAQQRLRLLQDVYDAVLPSYGFPKGNMSQLDNAIGSFVNVLTGSDHVKRLRCKLDETLSIFSAAPCLLGLSADYN